MMIFEEKIAKYKDERKSKTTKKIHRNRYWNMLQDGFIHEYTPLLDEWNKNHPDSIHAEYLRKKESQNNIIEDVSISIIKDEPKILTEQTCEQCDRYSYLKSVISEGKIELPAICESCGRFKRNSNVQ